MSEFDIIQRYFKRPVTDDGVTFGIGDDCALLQVPPDQGLAVSIDTLVAGVHFPPQTNPYDIGYKALAVNLSDLAAAGAEPRWATLALTLPEANEAWLEAFAQGFFTLAERYRVSLVGGDTTQGPLSITVQMHGLTPRGRMLRRAGARPGDLIYVTGTLGDAGLALRALQGQIKLTPEHAAHVMQRLNRPEPRITVGLALRDLASAAIDVSDGLAADLGHVLTASGVGASIELERLPLSPAVSAQHDWNLPLSSGDDYELCFTAPLDRQKKLMTALENNGCACTCIGMIEAVPGLRCKLANDELFTARITGYQHF